MYGIWSTAPARHSSRNSFRRGSPLKPGVNYDTDEVWSGVEAKELVLIDAIGTAEDMTTVEGMRSYNFGPDASAAGLLGRTMAEALVGRALEHVNNSPPPLRLPSAAPCF